MEGLDLLKLLIASTGLPEDAVERELTRLFEKTSTKPEDLNLESLREILAQYLQEVLAEAKDQIPTAV